jgi:mono/diheme cytochrome c family protein
MTGLLHARASAVLIAGVIAAFAGGATVAGPVSHTRLQTRAGQDYSSGPYLYRTFCASCHGSGGRGDGPVSDLLRQRPPDLTTIAARRGGAFPRGDVYAVIDGRRGVPAHGNREMPVWGDVLRATEGHDDAIIKRRIDALVMHIESLQAR